jgi:hypothetical protein
MMIHFWFFWAMMRRLIVPDNLQQRREAISIVFVAY